MAFCGFPVVEHALPEFRQNFTGISAEFTGISLGRLRDLEGLGVRG